jgi:hypothetical protein
MADEEINKLAEMFPHSIEITKGQKGGYGYTVKVRFTDDGLPKIDPVKVVSFMKALTDKLENEYRADGGK